MLKKAVYNREDFLKLNNLPQRLRIWAEDTELEDYIRDEAFYHRDLPRKAPMALEPLKVAGPLPTTATFKGSKAMGALRGKSL